MVETKLWPKKVSLRSLIPLGVPGPTTDDVEEEADPLPLELLFKPLPLLFDNPVLLLLFVVVVVVVGDVELLPIEREWEGEDVVELEVVEEEEEVMLELRETD